MTLLCFWAWCAIQPFYGVLRTTRTELTIESIHVIEKEYIVLSSQPTSPGTIAHYKTLKGTVVVQIYQRLTNLRFKAKVYSTQDKATFEDLEVGAKTETDAQLSHSITQFWESLRNIYLNDDQNWILHRPIQGSQTHCKVRVNEPILLDLVNPPISGYLCVFAVWPDHRVEVLYPNNLEGNQKIKISAHTPAYNLNYYGLKKNGDKGKMALINTGFAFDRPGKITVCVLLSELPRPISSFWPEASGYKYADIENKIDLKPSEFGPGIWNTNCNVIASNQDVDFLPADSWAIARLLIEIEK